MRISKPIVVAVAATTLLAATAGCSSSGSGGSGKSSGSAKSSGSGGSSGGASSGKSFKIGVLTSLTGSAASGFTTVEAGVKARLGVANAAGGVNGHKITYVMEDDASSPQGAATAVRKAVQQDKVFSLLSASSDFFGGYKVATQAKLPVFGAGFDGGPEWLDKSNTTLFDTLGGVDYTKVASTLGLAAKKLGVTKMAAVGYIEAPSAAGAAKASIASAAKAGIAKGPYTGLHFGSTDVGPAVLAIKNSGADGLYLPTIPNTAFAIIAGLAQAKVKMKMIALATGYGGDLLQSKEAVAAGQGAYFINDASPVEANTAGTQKFQAALKTYDNYTGVPTFAQYQGWIAADMFLAALAKAGSNPTQSSIVTNFRSATYDGGGLSRPIDLGKVGGVGAGMGPGNCINMPQLMGNKFILPAGLNPICGSLTGDTVKP